MLIYRRNERGAWNAKFHLNYNILLPRRADSWLLTPSSLSQSLYSQRSVVGWRHNQIFSDGRMDYQIFLAMGLRVRFERGCGFAKAEN